MIKQLNITNFQSHKDTSLDFDPGVNVIVGQSDSGKTAIIRALRWLVWNRPTGDSFRSNWGGDTVVEIQTEEGDISRWKDYNVNSYFIKDLELTAFGTDVPEEIVNILKIDNINLQQQLDSPFLLSDSPGEVASHFNKIARLDKIDRGLQNVQKSIRSLTQDITYNEKQIKNWEDDLTQYEHLEKMEVEIEVLEDLENKVIKKTGDKSKLLSLSNSLIIVNSTIQKESKILELETLVNSILTNISYKADLSRKLQLLKNLINDLGEIKQEIQENKETIGFEKLVNTIIEEKARVSLLQADLRTFNTLIRNIIINEEKWRKTKEMAVKMENEFHQAFPDICPLCGKPK